ncbi:MAG: VWD domain-containing protein, partial [Deltaproteobacteria bacterium]|nr:VWD domain-containing protein [Deltaproteobacteria bacterium]MBW2587990.1 VWD domain-containing protein [Deltaproteobacteria bacterium]
MNAPRQALPGTTTTLAATALVAVVLAACQASSGSSGVSVVDDAALNAYLQSITDEVAGDSTYRVVVYDADFAQAFALPRDEIALTLGMLAFIHNEAELACVLGHEIAHHRLGDVSEFFGGEASPPIDALHPLAQGWPEAQEQAADDLGLSLCAAAGYEPLCAAHLLFRAAGWDSDESVDELLNGDESTRPLVGRTQQALDTIGDGGLEGGFIGFREYIAIQESLVTDGLATDVPSPGGAPRYFPDPATVAEDLRRMAEEEFDEFLADALDATFDWRDRECSRDAVTVVPSNQLDAFGHCWSGCRANEICFGACGNPGIFYEVARSAGWRGEHDSFWEDTRNQVIGSRGAFTDQSCEDYCTDKIESGGLDLTAPQRKWWICSTPYEEGHLADSRFPGGEYTDYGALGSPDIFGDPHLVTMDGLRYDFHGVGEFIAMASTVDELVVQVRFAEVPALQASKTTAVAANVNGDRVGAYLGAGVFVVRVNGETVTPTGSWVRLPNDGSVQVDDDQVVFQWPDDTRLWVYYWGNVLDLSMTLASQRQAALVGLLGNADGDPTNEHITREGVPVDVPDEHGDARKEALYSEFGESWRIDALESLFDYEPGESSGDFQVPGFPAS